MNRNKLLDAFISNLANAVVHKALEKAIDRPEITEKYNKEVTNSWTAAVKYREKINPVNRTFPIHDIDEIRERVTSKVKSELNLRIKKGYQNINLALVDEFVDDCLKELKVL